MSARRVARLSPLVRVVTAPNPSPMTLEGTNTYIVGERAPVVIDPGPIVGDHLDIVLAEAGSPSLVLLTHHHVDHAQGAERFAVAAAAPLAAFGRPGNGSIADGARIDAGEGTLVAMHTPGHAADHMCFLLEEEAAVFTGDHVLGFGTSVIAFPDGDMAKYMESLERLHDAAPRRLYPGHGPVVEDPIAVLDYYLRHRREREAEVLAAIEDGDDSITAMVRRIYAAYDPALYGAAALSVRAHLEKLRLEGVVEERDGTWRPKR